MTQHDTKYLMYTQKLMGS